MARVLRTQWMWRTIIVRVGGRDYREDSIAGEIGLYLIQKLNKQKLPRRGKQTGKAGQGWAGQETRHR